MYLTPEQKNKYKVMSYDSCKRYCSHKHKNTSIIISITTYDDGLYDEIIKTKNNNVQDILYLRFCDLEYEDDSKFCMQYEDGKKIAEFVNEWYDKVDTIIVHCEGGVSRSAGVCAAIMRVKEGDDFPIFDSTTKHPNITCYIQTLKGFNYKLLEKD